MTTPTPTPTPTTAPAPLAPATTRALRVALIAAPTATVPSSSLGGLDQVRWLAGGLAAHGHQVTLIGAGLGGHPPGGYQAIDTDPTSGAGVPALRSSSGATPNRPARPWSSWAGWTWSATTPAPAGSQPARRAGTPARWRPATSR